MHDDDRPVGAGRLEPAFVESVADLPAVILNAARDGDVVITMGAGSIGKGAAQVRADAARTGDRSRQ